MLITTVLLFAIAAILGVLLITKVFRDKDTPKPVVYAHGLAAAMLFGVIDYIHLSDNERLFKKAGLHALLQVSAWLLFGVVLGMKLPQFPGIVSPDAVILIIESAAVGLMVAGNFIGGDLVYKDGVGRSTSET